MTVASEPTKLPHPWLAKMYASMVPRLYKFERSDVTEADMASFIRCEQLKQAKALTIIAPDTNPKDDTEDAEIDQ